ncbi:hypothetical protein EDB85DRAFT_551474 [Lactarius pseudohatsudake]|nr:hypothetical protein EDB85DRAFT_551474 [Lactarius pseudohatsudake]
MAATTMVTNTRLAPSWALAQCTKISFFLFCLCCVLFLTHVTEPCCRAAAASHTSACGPPSSLRHMRAAPPPTTQLHEIPSLTPCRCDSQDPPHTNCWDTARKVQSEASPYIR